MRRLALLLMMAGCHRATSESSGRFLVPLVAEAAPDDAVVATVDGRPIHASDVALQARARGSDARQALSDLIDAEVLAGEAARRGLDRDHDAEESAESSAVRRLLEKTFESEVTAATVPEAVLKHVYEKNRSTLDHDTQADLWHILIPVDKTMTAEQKNAARAAAEELARRARGVASVEKFQALAETVKAPRPAHSEHVVTERDGWTLKEFSYPAFDQLHKPGDTSDVVETSYGFHVMYLVGFRPPRHTTFAEAEPELRKGIFPEFQKPEFIHWSDRLAGSHQVDVHADLLK